MLPELPRLLSGFERLDGEIKSDYEDFRVEEIPLYPADGHGTHTFFLVEKAGLTTLQAVADIARALNVRRQAIGFAGMKDSRAVTRQWMSVEHVEPAVVESLEIARLRVLDVTRHPNKLRIGHLKGNSFVLKIRKADARRLADVQAALAELSQRGVPNYFGQQRFGNRGDTWELGRALLRGDAGELLDVLLGRPRETDDERTAVARRLYDEGEFERAAAHWPPMFRTERRILRTLIHANPRRALRGLDRLTRQFYVSAYQSHLFNEAVAARLATGLDRLLDGDLAWLHASGAVFRVTAAADEQPRADAFEISPSGPLFGRRMTEPDGVPAEVEAQVLIDDGITPAEFRSGPLRVTGGRRPLRFQPHHVRAELGADERGPYLELAFVLPRGCYATTLLRELFTQPQPESSREQRDRADIAADQPE